MVSIKGLNKADVLATLYNNSRPLGMGFIHYTPEPMMKSEAQKLLDDYPQCGDNQIYFDYLKGRVMKVDLTSDTEFDECLYDRDNGEGAAQRAIDSITKE